MTEQMNVPKLRFGEFKSHIAEPKKLGQLVDMKSGNTPSKSNPNFWGGAIPWISASSMKGNVFSESEQNVTQLALENGAKLATKGSLLLLVRGSMLFNKVPVGFAGRDVTYNQDVKAINLKNGDDNSYLFYWFKANEYKLLSMVTGTGIGAGKLDSEELLSLPFHQPKPEEQQKIASFLSKVDEKIALLTEKKAKLTEYKKGVMQQLFSGKWEEQNGQLTFIPPTLRFKEDDGSEFPDWTKSTLGDVGKVKMCKRIMANQTSENGDIPFFKIGTFGREPDAFISQELYDEYRHKFSFPNVGDILMSASGTLGRTVVYDGSPAYFQDSNIVWIENDGSYTTNEFLFYVYQIVKYQSEGGTIQRLYNNIIMSAVFDNPSLKEQKKIVKFLSAIDQKIDLANSELDKAKEWKKGLLQQMFV